MVHEDDPTPTDQSNTGPNNSELLRIEHENEEIAAHVLTWGLGSMSVLSLIAGGASIYAALTNQEATRPGQAAILENHSLLYSIGAVGLATGLGSLYAVARNFKPLNTEEYLYKHNITRVFNEETGEVAYQSNAKPTHLYYAYKNRERIAPPLPEPKSAAEQTQQPLDVIAAEEPATWSVARLAAIETIPDEPWKAAETPQEKQNRLKRLELKGRERKARIGSSVLELLALGTSGTGCLQLIYTGGHLAQTPAETEAALTHGLWATPFLALSAALFMEMWTAKDKEWAIQTALGRRDMLDKERPYLADAYARRYKFHIDNGA